MGDGEFVEIMSNKPKDRDEGSPESTDRGGNPVSSRAFLKRRGSIKTGPGSAVEDVRRARRMLGRPQP